MLRGTARADVIKGRGGNDRLLGKRGNDRLYGGRGADRFSCGPGRDVVHADMSDVKRGRIAADCEILRGLPARPRRHAPRAKAGAEVSEEEGGGVERGGVSVRGAGRGDPAAGGRTCRRR